MAGFEFSEPPRDLSQAVHEAGGAFSVCWENMSGTGVFQDQRAREIAAGLIAWVEANYTRKVRQHDGIAGMVRDAETASGPGGIVSSPGHD